MKQLLPRYIIVAILCLSMMSALIVRLGSLTLAEGQTYETEAESRSTRTTVLKGTRGKILDKNGIVLAYDETCYNVQFLRDAENRTDYYSSKYTESLIKAIEIIESGGGSTINTSYIQMNEEGELCYNWGVTDENVQKKRYYNFCSAMGFYVTEQIAADKTKWKTPSSAYLDMCKSWYIPAEMPFEQAVKVISIRQEVNLNNYKAYEPITIAYNVSVEVVSELEMRSDDLYGIRVTESTTRVYPYGETAAHIVGYLQRSADEEHIEEYGYAYDDFVGVSGVEYTMEKYLTGATYEHHGKRVIKVNKNGSEISEVSVIPATNGNDITLTIDLPLQQKVDESLKSLITAINVKEQDIIERNEDGRYTYVSSDGEVVKKDIKTAATGAIVVLDVTNGQVLAMSSYPSYDPNWFIKGLTDEQTKLLMTSAAATETTPMRNKAVSARLAPGSIFKIVTGFAGLMEKKITLDETIDDKYTYYLIDAEGNPITNNAPHCWQRDSSRHAHQNLVNAIINSCNYYFFEVSNRLGVDKLNEWAGKFGLNSSTKIETTGEAVGLIGGQSVWYDNKLPLESQQTSMPRFVYNSLRKRLTSYVKSYAGYDLDENSDAIKEAANLLLQLQDGSVSGKGNEVRKILYQCLGMPEAVIKQQWITSILSDLVELQWKDSQTIRTGIGQGSTLVTPVAVARYLATIANGGTVYDVHVVDSVHDNKGNTVLDVQSSVYDKIEAPPEYWNALRDGLKGVVSPEDRGTAANSFSKAFVDAGYISLISGKTGTAQIGAAEQIDIQNTSWFITYTPRENAEIAIVVCVPYGYSGASSVPAIEDIITYYYERKNAAAPENLTDVNGVTP